MLVGSLRSTLAASLSVSLTFFPTVLMATKRKYYAVAAGYEPGIYDTWPECQRQVTGFKGQKYKSFKSKTEAEQYLVEAGARKQQQRTTVPAKLKKQRLTTVAPNIDNRQEQRSTLSMPDVSTKMKGSQAALMNNPFRNYALQISSSVLDMAPADYEDCVDPVKSEADPDFLLENTPLQPLTHLAADLQSVSDVNVMYQLEYDGASKGNPGSAGAGALLRHPDGTVVSEVSVGLGKATNNVAEYRGLIAGMRMALDLGIQRVQAQGDSKLVTMQVRGQWKINNANLAVLCREATELLKNFREFQIRHVDREYNSAADALANKGVGLPVEKFATTFSVVRQLMEAT